MAKQSAEPSLKPGDIVKLASGGPVMTVGVVSSMSDPVECFWFADGELKQANIHARALLKAEVENPKS
jgi:uncharacterized protein YodC (DUF2158 family)